MVEVFEQRAADVDREVELGDERFVEQPDAALAVQQQPPGLLGVGRDRVGRRDRGDDDIGESIPGLQYCHVLAIPQLNELNLDYHIGG